MDQALMEAFRDQVRTQCIYIDLGAHRLVHALNTRKVYEVFEALQAILTAAANISKACWEQGGKRADFRKPLREDIQIEDDSPLREVTMRNNWDHYDGRLEQWWSKSKRHNHVDMCIGPSGTIGGVDDIDLFRNLDPSTWDLHFWGQQFNIKAIVQEAYELRARIRSP